MLGLQEEAHGYEIPQRTKELTAGQVIISPGGLFKMGKDGLIAFKREDSKRKLYQITALGQEILDLELARIERLYKTSIGESL